MSIYNIYMSIYTHTYIYSIHTDTHEHTLLRHCCAQPCGGGPVPLSGLTTQFTCFREKKNTDTPVPLSGTQSTRFTSTTVQTLTHLYRFQTPLLALLVRQYKY